MWQIITICFLSFLAVFGVTELVRRFWLYLMKPSNDTAAMMVIFLKEGIAVQQLRRAAEYISWEGEKNFFSIVALDSGLSEKTKEDVLKIVNANPNMMFGKKELVDFLSDMKV